MATKVKLDPEREERITMEIVVDCYDEYERAAGWYCYLQDELQFPLSELDRRINTWQSKQRKRSRQSGTVLESHKSSNP
jgi:hypothetical protein